MAATLLAALAVGAPREFLVVHHGAMAASNIRALAQCATSSLLLRRGARDNTRVWLLLPDDGLTVACDGRLLVPETQPALGKTLKRVLDPSRVNPSLELPPGWTVERGAVDLSSRLTSLGVRAGAASRRSASDARDAQLLRGRMQALRPDEIALREVASLPPPPPPPLDADAREAELLRRRVEAQRARRDLPFDELAAKAAATPAARDAGAAARFLVLDDRGEALTPQLLADVTPLDSAADAPTVVALAADAFTEDEERELDALGGCRAAPSPGVALLAGHQLVLAHAALDAEARDSIS